MNLEDARAALEAYARSEGHHTFRRVSPSDTSGTRYEGYILEVLDDSILFSYAPSPFDDSDERWLDELSLPIAEIDLKSLGC